MAAAEENVIRPIATWRVDKLDETTSLLRSVDKRSTCGTESLNDYLPVELHVDSDSVGQPQAPRKQLCKVIQGKISLAFLFEDVESEKLVPEEHHISNN